MFSRLLLLFILVPLLDLFLLLWLAQFITWQTTILIVILSGVLGAWLAAQQGRSVQDQIQNRLKQNQLPTGSLISDGAIILFAAGLLLTPGLLTDLFGLTLLVPILRNGYKAAIGKWLKGRVEFQSFTFTPPTPFDSSTELDPDVLEGKVVERGDSENAADDSTTRLDQVADKSS